MCFVRVSKCIIVLVDLFMVVLVMIVFLNVFLVRMFEGFRFFFIILMICLFVICVSVIWWVLIVGRVVLVGKDIFIVLIKDVMVEVVFIVM